MSQPAKVVSNVVTSMEHDYMDGHNARSKAKHTPGNSSVGLVGTGGVPVNMGFAAPSDKVMLESSPPGRVVAVYPPKPEKDTFRKTDHFNQLAGTRNKKARA